MTIFAHTVSASVLSLMMAKVDPSRTNCMWISLIVPASLDLDHLILMIKNRKEFINNGVVGNLHKARSFMHELLGVFIVGLFSLFFLAVDKQISAIIFISYTIHVIEDMIMGISAPFWPISTRECFLFRPSFKQKVVVDLMVIIISIWLWIRYLKG